VYVLLGIVQHFPSTICIKNIVIFLPNNHTYIIYTTIYMIVWKKITLYIKIFPTG